MESFLATFSRNYVNSSCCYIMHRDIGTNDGAITRTSDDNVVHRQDQARSLVIRSPIMRLRNKHYRRLSPGLR